MTEGTLLTPLSIVLAFIGVIEATLAFRVTGLQGQAQMVFVWFMVTFPAAVLIGFFYVQITSPVSWYPPSELNKTSMERLQFLDRSSQKLASIEFIDASNLAKSQTIGSVPPASQAIDLYKEGKYEQALSLFREALETYKQTPNPSKEQLREIAQTRANIGVTLSSSGRYSEALASLQASLEIYEKVGDELAIPAVLNNLASVYKNMGRYEEATAVYNRSLSLTEKSFGSAHPDVAITLNNLGSVYAAIGDYDKALALFQRSEAIYEKALGPDHPQIAASLNNLGSIY
ncbi:tetratricopeptide repeat protein [Azotobacter chroococcum]|uniref:tetratricopeptide repeat protein n=1 Tax=Azotobacter chroococcum TaxID=353 RepID=UPI0010ADB003|nr:tetratricopeptide repeat protein [Azotobacter chroococcum]TKD37245.1 tetratricopeptide repeat protein [Azotobacter chroococcum]